MSGNNSDWRDHEVGRRGVSVAQLSDDESVLAQVISDPYRKSTSESDNALHVPVIFMGDIPDHFTDMSNEEVNNEREYNIINSSTAFFNALLEAFPEDVQATGQNVEITAHQDGDAFTREYDINPQ